MHFYPQLMKAQLKALALSILLSALRCSSEGVCQYSKDSATLTAQTYLFYCNTECTYWDLYVLDFPIPPSRSIRTLPYKADTRSIANESVSLRAQLNMVQQMGTLRIGASHGRLRLVAQCVYVDAATRERKHYEGVMLREELQQSSTDEINVTASTPIAFAAKSQSAVLSASQRVQSCKPSQTPAPAQAPCLIRLGPESCFITKEASSGITTGYYYGCIGSFNATCVLYDGTVKAPCQYPIFLPASNLSSGKYNINMWRDDFPEQFNLSFIVPTLRVDFVNNSPIISGRTATVFVRPNRPVDSIICEVLTKNMLNVPPAQDCSNGSVSFQNMPTGPSRIRVISRARSERATIRTNLLLNDSDGFCSPYLINALIDVVETEATIHFASTGSPTGFICVLDENVSINDCQSPLRLMDLTVGSHKLKIVPQGCTYRYPQAFTFYI